MLLLLELRSVLKWWQENNLWNSPNSLSFDQNIVRFGWLSHCEWLHDSISEHSLSLCHVWHRIIQSYFLCLDLCFTKLISSVSATTAAAIVRSNRRTGSLSRWWNPFSHLKLLIRCNDLRLKLQLLAVRIESDYDLVEIANEGITIFYCVSCRCFSVR